MGRHLGDPVFHSCLSDYFRKYVNDKRALGYSYVSSAWQLSPFDKFLAERGLSEARIPEDLVREWIQKRSYEHEVTHRKRIKAAVHMGEYLVAHGIDAFIPNARITPRIQHNFRAHIFTNCEIVNILNAADTMPPRYCSPLQHVIIPIVIRVLLCCGMRSGEVVGLKMKDVDLDAGILTVVQGKFRKDRLVPLSPSITATLRNFVESHRAAAHAEDPLFPAPHGEGYSGHRLYTLFRELLWRAGIPFRGRGKGPRLHDLRHTFAVNRLATWYAQGEDLGVLLPALSTYMGHVDLVSTQKYLQMTAEMYPEIVSRLERAFHSVLPWRDEP